MTSTSTLWAVTLSPGEAWVSEQHHTWNLEREHAAAQRAAEQAARERSYSYDTGYGIGG